jgi:23S rRNA (pseudouridine1915-N3)-methyltransferase
MECNRCKIPKLGDHAHSWNAGLGFFDRRIAEFLGSVDALGFWDPEGQRGNAGTIGCAMLLSMQITLAYIGNRPGSKDEFDPQIRTYLERCSVFARCRTEGFRTEEAILAWLERQQGRTPALAVLLDGRGKQMTSEDFARWLGARRDEGCQHIVFAVGPASGWAEATRKRAQLLLSLGPMTLAHALARLVMAEQLYRAFTILTGHPYHAGH